MEMGILVTEEEFINKSIPGEQYQAVDSHVVINIVNQCGKVMCNINGDRVSSDYVSRDRGNDKYIPINKAWQAYGPLYRC